MKDRTRASIIQRSGESEGKDGAATLKYSPGGCGKLKRQHRVRKERQGSGIVLLARDGETVTSNRSIDMKDRTRASIIQRSGESEGKDGAATLKYSPAGW